MLTTHALSSPALPEDVWVEILGHGTLSYFDLVRFRRVCKAFRRLLERPPLARLVFRGPTLEKPYPAGQRFVAHPVFAAVEWETRSELSCPAVPTWRWDEAAGRPAESRTLDSFIAASESAVSPPVDKVRLKLGTSTSAGSKARLVTKPGAFVSVQNVFDGWNAMLAHRADNEDVIDMAMAVNESIFSFGDLIGGVCMGKWYGAVVSKDDGVPVLTADLGGG